MPRFVWTTALLYPLALTLVVAPGCTGKRRPQPQSQSQTQAASRDKENPSIIQPEDVDDQYDPLIKGERVRARYDHDDPAIGATQPLVTIVEFSDFQCPFCARLGDSLHDITREFPNDVKLVFKQFPLPMHAQAEPAARAALAAHQQDKFWEFHDIMFENQKALGDSQLEGYARSLGLDIDQWRSDWQDSSIKDDVADDRRLARALNVTSTPTFFINGIQHKGAKPPEEIRSLVEQEILTARSLLAAGVPRPELYARVLHAAPELAQADPTPPRPPNADADADAEPEHVPGEASRVANYAIPVGEGRPVRGPDDALVTIVEFGALSCDDCRAVQPTLNALLDRYPQDIRLVFRNLAETTPDRRRAQITLAAHKQGKFWEAHNEVLAATDDFTAQSAAELATKLGLDVESFKADLRDRSEDGPQRYIQEDLAVVNVFRGKAPAPLFFVNGRYLDGNPSLEAFEALVLEEKKKAEAVMAQSKVPPAQLYDTMYRTWRGFSQLQNALQQNTP